MIEVFKPTWMVKSIYMVSPEQLEKHHIHAVLTDLDNTLIAWNSPEGTQELRKWIKTVQGRGIQIIVVSNNNHDRIAKVVKNLNLSFVSRAMKPLTYGIKKTLRDYNLIKDEVVMVGDQYLTDVLAARNAGIRSILVQPIVQSDAWKTKINRFFEHFIINKLKRKFPEMRWAEDLDDN